jgi:hypothetical protein
MRTTFVMPLQPVQRWLHPVAIASSALVLGWILVAPPAMAAGGVLASHAASDRGIYPPPKVPKPGYLETYTDPSFGFSVTRVTGEPGQPTGCGNKWRKESTHHYNSMPAWNADGSVLLIKRPAVFLDGQTYEPICLHRPPTGDSNWHPTDPDLMIYVKDDRLALWNVRTGQSTTLGKFDGYAKLEMGRNNRSLLSNDGRFITLQAERQGQRLAFVYDVIDGKRYPEIPFPKDFEQAQGSSLGNYVILTRAGRIRSIYDRDGRLIGSYDALKHIDTAIDANGNEVIVGIRNRRPERPDDPPSGSIVMVDLGTARPTTLMDQGVGNHASARNFRSAGWAVISYDSARPPFDKEVVAVALDGSGQLVRLAHHYSNRYTYHNEPHANISPDGSKVIFASNWGVDGPTSAYVIDIGSHE